MRGDKKKLFSNKKISNKIVSRKLFCLLNNFCILWTARNSRDQKQWEICCVTARCVLSSMILVS